jgi:hypothetical protein
MSQFWQGMLTLVAFWTLLIFAAPGIAEWMAEHLERLARMLRRHATAMRAAYAAYAESWKKQA